MQLKLFSSALFNSLLYHRKLTTRQWLALFLLATGVCIAQVDFRSAKSSGFDKDRLVGLLGLVVACICSGLAGSMLENALKKDEKASLWERNIARCFHRRAD
jgi:UDP-sugar transporter A1/2/3